MKPNIGYEEMSTAGRQTLWSELLPKEFKERQQHNPTVYLPLGLCEPHGYVSAYGLDTIKAEWLCREAAAREGGIVAPSMGYHIHESGYHARWLEEEVGEWSPPMTSLPPFIVLQLFLYQLRAFVNAGFRNVIVVSGHSGGNQHDLRRVADIFMKHVPIRIWIRSDPELVEGLYGGDHAGKYELSQLMYLRPELVDMTRLSHGGDETEGKRLALGEDAAEASPTLGYMIMHACLEGLCRKAGQLRQDAVVGESSPSVPEIDYRLVELMWEEALQIAGEWATARPWPGQQVVTSGSRWKRYEYLQV